MLAIGSRLLALLQAFPPCDEQCASQVLLKNWGHQAIPQTLLGHSNRRPAKGAVARNRWFLAILRLKTGC
jgi:hypothetical protein